MYPVSGKENIAFSEYQCSDTLESMTKPACFSTKLSKDKFLKLKDLVLDQGFTLSIPQYTEFQARRDGVTVTLYSSGKLTVQGKNKDDFITFYLEPEILETVEYSYPEANVDFKDRIGVDEAGKGDFFGPLCISAVYANEGSIKQLLELGIKDSKTLSDKRALLLAPKIRDATAFETLVLRPEKYNELYHRFGNLNKLLAWGHATVIDSLSQKTGCMFATIDQFGHEYLVSTALSRKNAAIKLQQQHKGEEDIVIAAASILARAAFLQGIEALSTPFGFSLPKGASSTVKQVAKKIAIKDPSLLKTVCKTHFKTFAEVSDNASFDAD